MKADVLYILTFLLLPGLAMAQKKMLQSEAGVCSDPGKGLLRMKADSVRAKTDLLAENNTSRKISLNPDNMPCLIPQKTHDHMNFFQMNTDEVRKGIDDMPNAIPGKKSLTKAPAKVHTSVIPHGKQNKK